MTADKIRRILEFLKSVFPFLIGDMEYEHELTVLFDDANDATAAFTVVEHGAVVNTEDQFNPVHGS